MYDAIVVGARCGGAPLAMLLARAGNKVLMVDRMGFGTDIMSTHYVKRTGASYLDKWGLLDKVRAAGTPAIKELNFSMNGVKLAGVAPGSGGVDTDFTPRRKYLDKILVDAAIEAGVEARDRFTVKEVLVSGGAVVGIRGQQSGGSEVTERARVVIGADGINSIVANTVGAERYIDAGTHTCGHYAYFSGMRDRDDAASLYVDTDARRFYITFPTNDDLDMVFLFWPTEMAKSVRADLKGAFSKSLKLVPELEARVNSGQMESRISGTHLLPNFFRRAHGPGWALVGDAALHRDPITAQGITNAFVHADILAEELNQSFQGGKDLMTALADYDRRQFQLLKPMFDYTVHLSRLQPLPSQVEAMLPAVQSSASATGAFIGAFMGSVPLDQVFPAQLLSEFAADVDRCHEENRGVT
jgi:flavin-dependent dehydrogenase